MDDSKDDYLEAYAAKYGGTVINGKVVDGYIKSSNVSIESAKDASGSSVTGIDAVTSDDDGDYSFTIAGVTGVKAIIKAVDGTDTATEEAFEGVLKAPVVVDSGKKATAPLTPLTTIIASVIKVDELDELDTDTLESNKTVIATKLGIDKDIIAEDPIAALSSSNTTKVADAKVAYKKALQIQKTVEVMTKAIVASENDDLFDNVFDVVVKSIADTIVTETGATDKNISIDTIVTTKIDKIKEKVKQKINEKKDSSFTDLANVIEIIDDKIAAVKNVAAKVAQMLDVVDIKTDSAELEALSKQIEVVTTMLETQVEEIADVNDTSSISTHAKNALKTTKAVLMSGGVALAKEMNDASDSATNLLTTLDIETLSSTYDTIETSLGNITESQKAKIISKAMAEIAENNISESNITAKFSEVAKEVTGNETSVILPRLVSIVS
jgi:hypothetical protein